MVRTRSVLKITLIVACLAMSVPYGIPVYVDRLRLAWALRQLSMDERKVVLFAPWYQEAVALDHELPAGSTVDFVMAKPAARDIAVLGGAVLQPRDVRFFDGWEAWRLRRRAAFLRDDLAVNAASGPPPTPAATVVLVDAEVIPRFRVIRVP